MLSILLFVSVTFNAAAVDVVISAENIKATPGELITVPVKIKGNAGIMGFKITVNYPSDVLKAPQVSRGAVTSKGMFDSNIANSPEGTFDILWNHVSDIKENGTIFIVKFQVDENASNGKYTVTLTYSQPDTFNEKWEDVRLITENILVTVGEETQPEETVADIIEVESETAEPETLSTAQQTTTVTVSESRPTKETAVALPEDENTTNAYVGEVLGKVDSGYLQDIIDSALDNLGVDNIGALDDTQFEEFKQEIDNAFNDYEASIEHTQSGKQEFKQIYDVTVKENFINSVVDFVDSDKVASIIEEKLDSFHSKSFDKLNKDQKDNFADAVIDELIENGADIQEDDLKRADKIQVIEQLYEEVKPEEKISVLPVVIIALVCAAAVVTVVAVKNYKKKFEEEK